MYSDLKQIISNSFDAELWICGIPTCGYIEWSTRCTLTLRALGHTIHSIRLTTLQGIQGTVVCRRAAGDSVSQDRGGIDTDTHSIWVLHPGYKGHISAAVQWSRPHCRRTWCWDISQEEKRNEEKWIIRLHNLKLKTVIWTYPTPV